MQRKRLAGLVVISSVGFWTGCGPSLTMQGAHVKVVDASVLASDCQPISVVDAQGGSPDKAQILLRNKAGEMNASAVVISDKVENGSEFLYRGKAYRCPSGERGGEGL